MSPFCPLSDILSPVSKTGDKNPETRSHGGFPAPLFLALTGKRGQISVILSPRGQTGDKRKSPEALDNRGLGTKNPYLSPPSGTITPLIIFFLMLNNRDKRGQIKNFVPWPLWERVSGLFHLSPGDKNLSPILSFCPLAAPSKGFRVFHFVPCLSPVCPLFVPICPLSVVGAT